MRGVSIGSNGSGGAGWAYVYLGSGTGLATSPAVRWVGPNNGSAFGGISANTPFYNTTLGLAMFFGRFFIKVPVLALAGSLGAKKIVPVGAGTLPTHTPLFVAMLVGVIVIVGALTFIPALALGPFVEQLLARS